MIRIGFPHGKYGFQSPPGLARFPLCEDFEVVLPSDDSEDDSISSDRLIVFFPVIWNS